MTQVDGYSNEVPEGPKGRFYFQGVQILNDNTLEKLSPIQKTRYRQMVTEDKSLKLEAEDPKSLSWLSILPFHLSVWTGNWIWVNLSIYWVIGKVIA